MSAFVVDKTHIDVLVRAADYYGRELGDGDRSRSFRWWKTDDDGNFAGWFVLDPYAEVLTSYRETEEFVTPSRLGQILVDENVRSVSARYPHDDADAGELPGPVDAYYLGPYVYEDHGVVPTPGEVFNLIDCLDYQSCETDDWEKTQAATVLRFLRAQVCRHVEGYDTSGGWSNTAHRIVAERKGGKV